MATTGVLDAVGLQALEIADLLGRAGRDREVAQQVDGRQKPGLSSRQRRSSAAACTGSPTRSARMRAAR
jgi:hypothetical protein